MRRRERAQRPGIAAAEAQVGVDGVLEDEEAVLARELDEAFAAATREVEAGRVLQPRLERDHTDLVASQERFERVDVEAVRADRHREDLGLDRLQGIDRAHVRR